MAPKFEKVSVQTPPPTMNNKFLKPVKIEWKTEIGESNYNSRTITSLISIDFGCEDENRGNVMRNDLYFLHICEIDDKSYGDIKKKHRLRDNFEEFPDLVIKYMNDCVTEPGSNDLELVTDGTGIHSKLNMLLKTAFADTVVFTLNMVKGDDTAVMKFLASEMTVLKMDHFTLQDQHKTALESLDATESQLNTFVKGERERLQHAEHTTMETKVSHASEITAMKEQHIIEIQAVRDRFEGDMRSLRQQTDEQINSLTGQLNESQDQFMVLKTTLGDRERTIRELTATLSSLQSEAETQKSTVEQLRDENRQLDRSIHAAEKKDSRNTAEIEGLKTQLADAQSMIDRVQALANADSGRVGSLQDSIDQYKTQITRLEDKVKRSVDEINKANQIIQTLQNEVKASRTKVKTSKAVVKDRDEALAALRESLRTAERTLDSLRREVESLEAEKERVEGQVVTLTSKLAEAQGVIEGNQKVMAYLNSELTERRLGAGRHVTTSIPKPASTTTAKKLSTIPLSTAPAAVAWPPKPAPRFTAYTTTTHQENVPATVVNPMLTRRWNYDENARVNDTIKDATNAAKAKESLQESIGGSKVLFPPGLVPDQV